MLLQTNRKLMNITAKILCKT